MKKQSRIGTSVFERLKLFINQRAVDTDALVGLTQVGLRALIKFSSKKIFNSQIYVHYRERIMMECFLVLYTYSILHHYSPCSTSAPFTVLHAIHNCPYNDTGEIKLFLQVIH